MYSANDTQPMISSAYFHNMSLYWRGVQFSFFATTTSCSSSGIILYRDLLLDYLLDSRVVHETAIGLC